MNDKRSTILTNIKSSLGVNNEDEIRHIKVSENLFNKPKGIIPQRGQLKKQEQIDLFTQMAKKVHSTVDRVDDYSDVSELISNYMRGKNLEPSIKIGHDKRLAKIDWTKQPHITVSQGPSDGGDLVGLSHAFCAIAETGTLLMLSGNDNPTTLNFLPDHHIVLVSVKDIYGHMEKALDQLNKGADGVVMPRALNFITGPSRSGDIEQKLLLGAHGPRALKIIIVG